MSTPVFIDIAVPEQTSELRSFLKSLGAEICEENSESGILTDLKNVVEASTICWKEIQTDGEVEMLFNGIISLILMVPPEGVESLGTLFCEKIVKATTSEKRLGVRVKLLSNLFYGLPDVAPLRYTVYCAMLKLAGQGDLSLVPTDLNMVKEWISQWNISSQKTQHMLRILYDALVEGKMSEQATAVMIELLGTYTEDNASQARDDAHKCIVTCLADPSTYLMDHLLSLKPVKFLEGELIHDLLSIFVSGKLSQYQQFYKNNTDFVNSLGLSHDQNMRKMRLLTFMQMAENKKEIEFSIIQEEMQLSSEQVEEFIIDVLRTKAVRARIDQIQKKVVVISTTHRTFTKHHWQVLRSALTEWQETLKGIEGNFTSLSALQTQVPS
ncbi:eukaryotic translation initiation factor 3 subunit M-like [Haliotis rufescens]|uniref:eukaryotic translation initiation factor 3 subunit M-like n=1 Tax=Haliotis rufescens TaxID=6454 RepID=UPI001EB06F99|nr:eukaryotic translation initiation factor 3 subunit M-like [Haliotis rufescens]